MAARRRAERRAQRGMALIGLLTVAVVAFAYVMTSRLNAASQFVGIDRDQNAAVLAQAKRALIGYMAQQAAMAGENNPGHLPCPEAPANFGTSNEGIEAPFCAAQAVGRLPWRTLGLEKLVDAAGEPLWYAISPGWHRPNSGATLTINSDSAGQLAVDGIGNSAVAVIIAPGPAITAQTGPGCAARSQARPVAGPPDLRDYLECENGASPPNASFVSNRTGQTFNDQVLRVTVADIMPALEAAIAERVQREIAPAISAGAYTSTQYSGIPSGVPLYPYPVPFSNPTSSSYLGGGTYPSSSNPQGLLPVNQIGSGCASPHPCTTLPVTHPTTIRSTAAGYVMSYSCSVSAGEVLCQGQYHEHDPDPTQNVRIEMAVTFSNVAMGFRALAASPVAFTLVEARDNGSSAPWLTPTPSIVNIRMNDGVATLPDGSTPPRGSVTIRFHATLPNIDVNGWETYADFRIRISRAVFDDQPFAKASDPTLGWFVRNEWYRSTYYAVARAHTPDWLPALGCSTSPSATPSDSRCLRFNASGTYNVRALLVLAGRGLPTRPARPSNDLLAYVEDQNGDNGTLYEQRLARMSNVAVTSPFFAPWNDRVVIVEWHPSGLPTPAASGPQVTSSAPLRLHTIP